MQELACAPQLGGEDRFRCSRTQSDLLEGQALDFPPEKQALVLLRQGVEGLHNDLQHILAFEQGLERCGIGGEHRQLVCIERKICL